MTLLKRVAKLFASVCRRFAAKSSPIGANEPVHAPAMQAGLWRGIKFARHGQTLVLEHQDETNDLDL